MAEVFRAKRTGVEGFEKVVAVKRILSHLSDNKEFVDMFIDEAKMVAGLAHPNVVQIFDLGKHDKNYWIAMEYVHGRDLRTIIRAGPERGLKIPLDISTYVVSKVCAALEYAHRKKDDKGQPMLIVHRDISPQNILISFEGDVKLTDFGIAKAASKASTTDKGALRGKLLYMSPEQAWGKAMDKRSDVFSLGIVFYEMLTEQKPFLGTSETSILETVRECRVPPPTTINDKIPEKLEKVVMKALERDPEVRYQDAGEMLRDLERVLHEWQPATASGLVRFLEILFDEHERGDVLGAEARARAPARSSTSCRSTPEPPPAEPPPAPRPRTRCPSRSCSSGSASSRGGRLHMALSKEQEQFYQSTLEMTRKQITELNTQIEEELAKVKERLAELQNAKNAAKQIYDGACKMLGVENDLDKEDVVAE
jgi:serine/threonine protein kinase